MNFDWSGNQNVLRGEVRKSLAKEFPVSAARHVIGTGASHAEAARQHSAPRPLRHDGL